jgi:hypothetical protein
MGLTVALSSYNILCSIRCIRKAKCSFHKKNEPSPALQKIVQKDLDGCKSEKEERNREKKSIK